MACGTPWAGGTRRGGLNRIGGQAQKPLLWLDMHLHCIVKDASLITRGGTQRTLLTEAHRQLRPGSTRSTRCNPVRSGRSWSSDLQGMVVTSDAQNRITA